MEKNINNIGLICKPFTCCGVKINYFEGLDVLETNEPEDIENARIYHNCAKLLAYRPRKAPTLKMWFFKKI